jgi:hypothetical protein
MILHGISPKQRTFDDRAGLGAAHNTWHYLIQSDPSDNSNGAIILKEFADQMALGERNQKSGSLDTLATRSLHHHQNHIPGA